MVLHLFALVQRYIKLCLVVADYGLKVEILTGDELWLKESFILMIFFTLELSILFIDIG